MSLSMYQASIPVFTRQLNNLSTILSIAAAHAEEKKIEQSVFLNARLQSLSAAQIDGSEARTVTLKRRDKETHFQGQAFLLDHVLPNFYFHLTTAYAILRHNGVAIGKRDFLGTR